MEWNSELFTVVALYLLMWLIAYRKYSDARWRRRRQTRGGRSTGAASAATARRHHLPRDQLPWEDYITQLWRRIPVNTLVEEAQPAPYLIGVAIRLACPDFWVSKVVDKVDLNYCFCLLVARDYSSDWEISL